MGRLRLRGTDEAEDTFHANTPLLLVGLVIHLLSEPLRTLTSTPGIVTDSLVVNSIYPGPQTGSVGSRSFAASRGVDAALSRRSSPTPMTSVCP